MTKTTHTNRATCQVCGRIQAIDNGTQITAKHGYVVAGFGFFNGVCPGARYLPAEKSLDVTHEIIGMLTATAVSYDALAKAYGDFKLVGSAIVWGANPAKLRTYMKYDANAIVTKKDRFGNTFQRKGTNVSVEITAETPASVIAFEQDKAKAIAEQEARRTRSHIDMMQTFIVPRLGQEMFAGSVKAKADRKAVKAAKVEGSQYPTKVSRKNALDEVNSAYNALHRKLQNIYLRIPHDMRTKAQQDVYYGPSDLCNWRPKHAEAALAAFPDSAGPIVAGINNLVTKREEIKNAK